MSLSKNINNRYVVIFDGVCNLCNATVKFILKYDKKEQFVFTTSDSKTTQTLLSSFNNININNSVLLVYNNTLYQQSDAVLQIARRLQCFWWMYAFVIVPKSKRDYFYNIIANKRYKWFGKRNSCMISDQKWKNRFI